MHPYLLAPLLAFAGSLSAACVLVARDPRHPTNRVAAGLLLSSAAWALCELVWNTRANADEAVFWVRVSAIGWVWIGPVALHLLRGVTQEPAPRLGRFIRLQYGIGLGFLLVAWATPLMVADAVRTPWGWSYVVGPAFPLYWFFTIANTVIGAVVARRSFRDSRWPGERIQGKWLSAAVAIPLVVASATDSLLPILGQHPPRFGTLSFAMVGWILAGNLVYFGYSIAAPGAFAQEILGSLRDGVALLHRNGRIRACNAALSRLAGLRRASLEGVHLHELVPGIPLDPACETDDQECTFVTSDGRSLPVSVGTALLRDRRTNAIGLVVVIRDISEVVTLRTRLIMSGRLAAVGELAAGIAHEINNPMAFIRTNLTLLESHWKTLSKAAEPDEEDVELRELVMEGEDLIAESLEGVDRAAAFVRDVKNFSHAGSGEREEVDLNALLDSVVRVAAPQFRQRGRIEKDYGELPAVWCAPQQLKQVFLNLVINASQAIGDRGVVRLSSEPSGRQVIVHIQDDGEGIPNEHVERIFDPFFTTKPVGEGTGLGLAISYEIVRKHGGEIRVRSTPGRGTRFSVYLPIGRDED